MEEDRLNTREAAALLTLWYGPLMPATLRNWRCDGKGPPYRPGRPVTYGRDELIAWSIGQLADEPRRIVELHRAPRAVAGRTRDLVMAQCREHAAGDDLAWLVVHWYDQHETRVPISSITDVTGTTRPRHPRDTPVIIVTIGELFLQEMASPDGNPRVAISALRRRYEEATTATRGG